MESSDSQRKTVSLLLNIQFFFLGTVCPGSSDPPEKIFNIFASENEVNTFY